MLAAAYLRVLSVAPPTNYTAAASHLRRTLLTGYDKTVPPVDSPVELQIRFFKIESIEARISVMRLKVWLRYYWTDSRLTWEPSEHGNVQKIYFAAKAVTDPELSEVWVPDLAPYNSKIGIDATLDASLATVSPSGRIFWSRPGVLEVLCRFSGLVAFPFDTLKCSIEIGGWALSGAYQDVSLRDGVGWTDGTQEATAGSSYQEFVISDVSTSVTAFEYASDENEASKATEPWPNIRYDITLRRSSLYHQLLILAPGIILTSLALTVFFMRPDSSERLSFGITLILANEVTKIGAS